MDVGSETELILRPGADVAQVARQLFGIVQDGVDEIARSNLQANLVTEFQVLDLDFAQRGRRASSVRDLRDHRAEVLWNRVDFLEMSPTVFRAQVVVIYPKTAGQVSSNGLTLALISPSSYGHAGRLRLAIWGSDPEFAASLRFALETTMRKYRIVGKPRLHSRSPSASRSAATAVESSSRPTGTPAITSSSKVRSQPEAATNHRLPTRSPTVESGSETADVDWPDKAVNGGIAVMAGVVTAVIIKALGLS